MIRLISGATRINGRTYRPSDGAFSADAEVETRLISAGVAVFSQEMPPLGAVVPSSGEEGAGAGNNMPDGWNATEATGEGFGGDVPDAVGARRSRGNKGKPTDAISDVEAETSGEDETPPQLGTGDVVL